MSKKRIYELAKELNVSNKEVIEVAKKNGFKVISLFRIGS